MCVLKKITRWIYRVSRIYPRLSRIVTWSNTDTPTLYTMELVDSVTLERTRVDPTTPVGVFEVAWAGSSTFRRRIWSRAMLDEFKTVCEEVQIRGRCAYLNVSVDDVVVTEKVMEWAGPRGDFFDDCTTWKDAFGCGIKKVEVLTDSFQVLSLDVCSDMSGK